VADEQYSDQQRQAAGAGNDQRHARAVAGVCVLVPVADQKE
jgi:hypothetical protein